MELHFPVAVFFMVQAQPQRWVPSYVILCLSGPHPCLLAITVQMAVALHDEAVPVPESKSHEGRVSVVLLCLRHFQKHDRLFLCKADSDILTWSEQGVVEMGVASPAVIQKGASGLCFVLCHMPM